MGQRSFQRIFLGRAVFGIGLAYLAVYVAARLHRQAGSVLALSAFESQNEAALAVPIPDGAIDFRLWSEKRINAYRESLTLIQSTPMAVLSIDRLQIKAPGFPPTDELVLNRGLGWIPGTAKPGYPVNSGVAGRDGLFRALRM